MIELIYLASQIQCGANSPLINVQVEVYQNQELIQTMHLEDKVLLPVNSVQELNFKYKFLNATCSPATPTEMVLGSEDPVPNVPGVYDQQSIQQMLDGLNDYEELFLVELGTTNKKSSAFDLQDVVLLVNNNPQVNSLVAD
jgi:hypothetical protein